MTGKEKGKEFKLTECKTERDTFKY